MNCPKCRTASLSTMSLPGRIEVDACAACGGVWFEKGELGEYANFAADIPDYKRLLPTAKPVQAPCPSCGNGMVALPFAGETALEVDHCPKCLGVWFDGGELDLLTKVSKESGNKALTISRAIWEMRKRMGKTAALPCPACEARSLHTFNTAEKVTVDFCQTCKGIWLEAGETAVYTESEKDLPDLAASLKGAHPSTRKCPSCRFAMDTLRYDPADPLEIERCAKCGGIWLDSGEIDRLETLSADASDAKSAGKVGGGKIFRTIRTLTESGYRVL